MKLIGNLHFNVKLEATIPDAGFLGLLNPDEILKKASKIISPILHNALKVSINQLLLIGVKVKVLESGVSITQEP